jgi:large subunit ribosomal protein L21
MYAVIKTGGKQYRVQPGDVLVVEKLDGEAGAAVKFDQVLMHGDGDTVTLGAPVIEGALVHATLIETRKGEKIKIFKKIRRQGYRRTRGHRQFESVLRVTGLELGGKTTKWDGEVDLSSKALLNARARGLKHEIAALEGSAPAKAEKRVSTKAPTPAKAKAGAKEAVAEGVVDPQEAAVEAPAKPAAPKTEAKAKAAPVKAKAAPAKAAAPKAEAKPAAPKTEAKAKAAPKAKAEAAAPKSAPKKAAAKAKPASGKTKA